MSHQGEGEVQSDTTIAGDDRHAKLFAALAKAQGAFKELAKNREVTVRHKSGGQHTFRYADLEACITATRPALAENGLAVLQMVNNGSITTMLTHEGGGSMSSAVNLPGSNGDPKQFGALITYYRRYTYCAMLGIAADDDLDEDSIGSGGQEYSDGGQEAAKTQERKPKPSQQKQETTPGKVNNAMINAIRTAVSNAGKSEEDLCKAFGVGAIEDLPRSETNNALTWARQS